MRNIRLFYEFVSRPFFPNQHIQCPSWFLVLERQYLLLTAVSMILLWWQTAGETESQKQQINTTVTENIAPIDNVIPISSDDYISGNCSVLGFLHNTRHNQDQDMRKMNEPKYIWRKEITEKLLKGNHTYIPTQEG